MPDTKEELFDEVLRMLEQERKRFNEDLRQLTLAAAHLRPLLLPERRRMQRRRRRRCTPPTAGLGRDDTPVEAPESFGGTGAVPVG